MASVISYAPIAAQLGRMLSLDELLPRDAAEEALREYLETEDEPPIPAGVEEFFAHYLAITRAAFELLNAPQFDRLARFYDAVEEHYMPGGPPVSPVYDSFAAQLTGGSVPQGVAGETPYSVLARLLLRDPSRARLQRMAQSLSDARFDLYRVLAADEEHAELEPVRGGSAFSVRLLDPGLRAGDFGLMRVLGFEDAFYIADSPYLLTASVEEWRDHCARVVARQQTPAAPSAPKSGSKSGKKDKTRKRRKNGADASRKDPEQILAHYFKFGLSERYWLDYVRDAYAGERRGIVFLAGVPDRPELLPHPEPYARGEDASPLVELRAALMEVVTREDLLERALQELEDSLESAGQEAGELDPNEEHLLIAYAMFGLRAADGTVALERFECSPEAEALRPEVRAALESLKQGWFSVFRVERIHLDERLEVLDVLRSERLAIEERLGTRQLGLGDLVIGWVCRDQAGTITLEGGIAHVPAPVTEPILQLAAELGRELPPLSDAPAWKRRAATLPVARIAALLQLRAAPPLQRASTRGAPLQLVTQHYRIRDRARVLEVLEREFVADGDGTYRWVSDADILLATLELSKSGLLARVNSRQRLEAVQQRLETLLGAALERTLEAREDVEQAVRGRTKAKVGQSKSEPELPPELAAQFHQMVLDRIRATLDEPIPQFRNRTLRALARTQQGRADVIAWLRDQERILKINPQLAGLDMRPLWQELSLPYQGLDTDPPP